MVHRRGRGKMKGERANRRAFDLLYYLLMGNPCPPPLKTLFSFSSSLFPKPLPSVRHLLALPRRRRPHLLPLLGRVPARALALPQGASRRPRPRGPRTEREREREEKKEGKRVNFSLLLFHQLFLTFFSLLSFFLSFPHQTNSDGYDSKERDVRLDGPLGGGGLGSILGGGAPGAGAREREQQQREREREREHLHISGGSGETWVEIGSGREYVAVPA